MKVIYAPFISIFGVNGMTIGRYVLVSMKNPSRALLNHERIHVDQIKKVGFFKFYLTYLNEYLANRFKGLSHWDAYRKISYEVEAYNNQRNFRYKVK